MFMDSDRPKKLGGRLKQAKDSGLLTETEFEQKRRKLISDI